MGLTSVGSTCFETNSSTSPAQLSLLVHRQAARGHRGGERVALAVGDDVDPGPRGDRVAQRLAGPRGREVDLRAGVADLLGDVGDHLLQRHGDVVVVGVGLVELEHRELWVVLRRQPLVAEVLAQLVDALQPADDAALQIQLGRDPQVERSIERVVVGRERTRRGAAVDRLKHRRLDLDEAALVEEAADRRDRACPRHEPLAHGRIGDQVQLAVAQSRLDVGQPVVLVGQRTQRLGQHGDRLHEQRQLAPAGAEDRTLDADQVAEVQCADQLELRLVEHVRACVQLEPAAAVDQVEKGALTLPAPRGHATGEPEAQLGVLAGRQLGELRANLADRRDARERVRIRVEPVLAEPLELTQAGQPQLFAARSLRRSGLVAHERPTVRSTDADVDLGDLEPARRAARYLHAHDVAALVPE